MRRNASSGKARGHDHARRQPEREVVGGLMLVIHQRHGNADPKQRAATTCE
jgi:hypothetical protein